ncbi:MAG: sigma factor [Polyangiaceae bacterium]
MIPRAAASRPALRLVPGRAEGEQPPSDEQIIEAVQRGEHRVAALLYDRLFGVVNHTLFRVFGRREVDHDDLVQTVFEQIVVTLSRRSYARACNLKTWASSIASHVGFNALRSRRRERRVLDREVTVEGSVVPARTDSENLAAARVELESSAPSFVGDEARPGSNRVPTRRAGSRARRDRADDSGFGSGSAIALGEGSPRALPKVGQ